MECSFCTNKPILISGRKYCEDHIGEYECTLFEMAVMKKFDSVHKTIEFFEWAFGTRTPKLSNLQKWHERIPRVERKNQENWRSHGIYEESQECYIRRIADEYMKEIK